jgi:hypothetical protein
VAALLVEPRCISLLFFFLSHPVIVTVTTMNLTAASSNMIRCLFFTSPVAWPAPWKGPTSEARFMREVVTPSSNSGWPATGHWAHFLDANSSDCVTEKFFEAVGETGVSAKLIGGRIVVADFCLVSDWHAHAFYGE